MKLFKLAGLAGMMGALSLLGAQAESNPWQTFTAAKLQAKTKTSADFVDFEADGRAYSARLLFFGDLQSPEAAAYFGKASDAWDGAAANREATSIIREALRDPFTIYYRAGESPAAVALTANGYNVLQILAERGYLRLEPELASPALPNGQAAGEILSHLKQLEQSARAARAGLWGNASVVSSLDALPVAKPPAGNHFRSDESKPLREAVGKVAKVRGRLSRIGQTNSGHIIFLNFEGNRRNDFCAIIRRDDLPVVAIGQPSDFPENLVGKYLEIRGVVSLHNETPQIEVRSPGQIMVVR